MQMLAEIYPEIYYLCNKIAEQWELSLQNPFPPAAGDEILNYHAPWMSRNHESHLFH